MQGHINHCNNITPDKLKQITYYYKKRIRAHFMNYRNSPKQDKDEHRISVEVIEDHVSHPLVIPMSMDQQKGN